MLLLHKIIKQRSTLQLLKRKQNFQNFLGKHYNQNFTVETTAKISYHLSLFLYMNSNLELGSISRSCCENCEKDESNFYKSVQYEEECY